jgi:hypothetical protein
MHSPDSSESYVHNDINKTVSNVFKSGSITYPCIYDEMDNVCYDINSEAANHMDAEYIHQYNGGSILLKRFYEETIRYDVVADTYVGTINPQEVKEVKFSLSNFAGLECGEYIAVAHTKDKRYWTTY